MGAFLHRRFLLLLWTLLGIILVYPLVRRHYSHRVIYDLLMTLLFGVAILHFFRERFSRGLAVVLGGLALLGLWTQYTLPGVPPTSFHVGFHLGAALFDFFLIYSILRIIGEDPRVTPDSIYGAFCSYLLIGIAFGHLFCVVETYSPGSFQGSEEVLRSLGDPTQQHFLLTYFSLVTLTTVGYGDLLPISQEARSLAMVEAILGQFFVAVLIAGLVGKRITVEDSKG